MGSQSPNPFIKDQNNMNQAPKPKYSASLGLKQINLDQTECNNSLDDHASDDSPSATKPRNITP
jgi:hypothetical protein